MDDEDVVSAVEDVGFGATLTSKRIVSRPTNLNALLYIVRIAIYTFSSCGLYLFAFCFPNNWDPLVIVLSTRSSS